MIKKERHLKLVVFIAALLMGLALLTSAPVPTGAATAAVAADGSAVFGSKCALCHGKDGSGLANWRSKGQPDLTDAGWQRSHSDTQIAETIRSGKGKFMPSFRAKLSDQEVNALVSQIRSFAKKK